MIVLLGRGVPVPVRCPCPCRVPGGPVTQPPPGFAPARQSGRREWGDSEERLEEMDDDHREHPSQARHQGQKIK